MRSFGITDPDTVKGRQPEQVLLLIESVPDDADDWGALEPLRGTSWEHGVKEIPAEALSHALHGRFLPLRRALGRDPKASARRVLLEEGECALKKACIGWNPDLCRPGGSKRTKGKMEYGPPDCYSPPLSDQTPGEVVEVFMRVAQAWREGRYVVVVKGTGFNFA